jgi:hypothetical protein
MYPSHESQSRLGYNCPPNTQSQEMSSQPAVGVSIPVPAVEMPNALYTGRGTGIHGGLMFDASGLLFDSHDVLFVSYIFYLGIILWEGLMYAANQTKVQVVGRHRGSTSNWRPN